MGVWDACIQGTREVFFVVIATSMTLAVVFIPVIFLQGFTGRLFREFGIVLAGAVLISAFVSLTLTPVLNLKLGRITQQHSRFYRSTEPFFAGLEATYRRVLAGFMRRKWLSFLILGVCVVLIRACAPGRPQPHSRGDNPSRRHWVRLHAEPRGPHRAA
jgi:multidrug efflux pump subunit AcrB